MSPIRSRKECYDLLSTCSIQAMRKFKCEKGAYYNQINQLSEVCHILITYYKEEPDAIIAHMKSSMEEAHQEALNKIDEQIAQAYQNIKNTPNNRFFGQNKIIHLSTQITMLTECKTASVEETIQRTIYDSLVKALQNYNTPDLDPSRYDYRQATPIPSPSDG